MDRIITTALEVLENESKAIEGLKKFIDAQFVAAVKAILEVQGKVVVTGMGKSGIIGRKISATLASTGTPSFFLHPGEAFHGDLGMVTSNDIILAIANSGETDEVLRIIPFFKENENTIISITGNPESTLAHHSLIHITAAIDREACPLDLAPTTSATAAMVMGDALAIALMKLKNFKEENYAKFHPGGSLGRKLLTKARDLMRTDELPIIGPEEEMITTVNAVSAGRLGLALVQDNDKLLGVITDGDLRRAMRRHKEQFFALLARDIMTKDPKTISPEMGIVEVQKMMNTYKITSLIVSQDAKALGVIQIYDIKI